MKKGIDIGIITMFYGSTNFGGILQSYAMVQTLEKLGYKAEQICYDMSSAYPLKKKARIAVKKLIHGIKNARYVTDQIRLRKRNNIVKNESLTMINHSKKVYNERNIIKSIDRYSCFIVGSDQVWIGGWPAFFLSFVPDNRKKIAYAVSTGKTHLTTDEIDRIKYYSNSFSAISVREADTAELLGKALPEKNINFVLDPTLLLDISEWNKVTSDNKVRDKYIFCYYLGSDVRMRRLATEYAQKHKLKVVTIPHMQGKIEKSDIGFGDYRFFDTTPQDFLSLIKNAEIVFTDSFHATVFSTIFHKQFVAFGRTDQKEMNNRFETLLEMYSTVDRFICENEGFSLVHIEKILNADYSIELIKYERMKEKSVRFLVDSLK